MMTELNPSVKKKKEASLSKKPTQEPVDKDIPLKRLLHQNRKCILNFNSKTLFLENYKTTKRRFLLRRRPEDVFLCFSQKSCFKFLCKITRLKRSLKKSIIDMNEFFDLDDRDLLLLAHGHKGLKGLESITLRFPNSYTLSSNRRLSLLMKELTKINSLKSLSLDISGSEFSDAGLISTSRSIKKMKFLKDIHIDCSDLPKATHKGMAQMNSSFNRLRKVENVNLVIRACSKTKEAAHGYQNSPLMIRSYSQMTDESLKKMRLERLISLRSIILDFGYYYKLTDKSIDLITRGLKKLPNLQIIKLKFWNSESFSDASLSLLWRIMNSLPSLQGVTLHFKNCWDITDAAFDDMNKTLQNLALIKKFHMEFYNCSLTDHGLVDLCKVLKRAVSLQNLSVYWRNGDETTDIPMKEFIDCISRLTQLRKIGIDFLVHVETTSLEDEISKFFRCQTALEKISLGISEFDGVKSNFAFVKEICNIAIKMPNLRIKYFIKPFLKQFTRTKS